MADHDPLNSGGTSPVFNANFLRDTLGSADPGMLSKFYGLLLEQIEPMPETLRNLASGSDAQAVREYAHKLKSSTRTVGAQALGDLLEAIEHAARDGDFERVRGSLADLRRLAAETEAEVRQEMARLQAP